MTRITSALAAAIVLSPAVVAADRPNFVFMFADDQRYDAMSVVQKEQGDKGRFPWFQTPNMDRLAADGVRFRNAFVVNSLCSPSRACFLSGKYSHVNGIYNNHTPLSDKLATHAAILRAEGYSTGYVGKWHMGTQPVRPGFDWCASFTGQGQYFGANFLVNGTPEKADAWTDHRSGDYAVRFLEKERAKDKPFLLVVGFKAPHGPFDPPKRLANAFAGETARRVPNLGLPPGFNADLGKAKDVADKVPVNLNYFRCIAGVDENVGKILDALDRLKLTENTVVVYASDNGFYLGEHTLADKRSGYDESLRIPLIVRYPKSGLKGITRDDLVLNIDLAPTFLDLAGVAVPKDMHGKSWKPLLAKEAPKEPFRTSFFYEYFEEGACHRRGRLQHPDDDRRPNRDAQVAQVPRPSRVDGILRPRGRPVRDNEPVCRRQARRSAGETGEGTRPAGEGTRLRGARGRARGAEALTRPIMHRLTATVLFLAFSALASAAEPPARPNILLILADDLGFSDLSCYGGEIATPNLDAQAKNGLRFRQFYNCTRCCPTRASLVTGLYPHQAGVGDMNADTGQPGYRGFLQANTVTIAEVLKAAGYHTSMVGKWHLGGPKRPTPTDRGFDEFYGMIGGFNSCFQEDPFYTRLPAGRTKRAYAKDAFYSTDAFGDYAIDFLALARKEKKPFFQYLAFNAPHFPLQAKAGDIQKYADAYASGWDKVREARHKKQIELGLFPKGTLLSPRSSYTTRADFLRTGENPAWDTLDTDRRADLARRMAVYAAMVECMDRNIGRVIDDLKKHGEFDNTLVLFLSDNGACAEWDPFGFDGASGPKNILHKGDQLAAMGGPKTYHSYGSGWANAGCTPFRMYKHYCHEGGIRTPLIAHWPNGIAAKGEFRDQVGHVIDLMATCVDVGGAKYPATRGESAVTPMEGKSLVPAFAGKPLDRQYLAWEHEGNRAIREERWKLVAKANAAWELYDLDADPVELSDQAAKQPDRVKELAAKWDDWAKRCNVLPYPLAKKK